MSVYVRSPAVYGRSLVVYGRSPAVYGRSLVVYGRSPCSSVWEVYSSVREVSMQQCMGGLQQYTGGLHAAVYGRSTAVYGRSPCSSVWEVSSSVREVSMQQCIGCEPFKQLAGYLGHSDSSHRMCPIHDKTF